MSDDLFQMQSVQNALLRLDQAGIFFAWPDGVMLLGDALEINRERGQAQGGSRARPFQIPREPIIVAVSMGTTADPMAFLDGLARFQGLPGARATQGTRGKIINFTTRQVRDDRVPGGPSDVPSSRSQREPLSVTPWVSSLHVGARIAMSADERTLVAWRDEGSRSMPATVAICLYVDEYREALVGGSEHRVPGRGVQRIGIPDDRHVGEVVESAVLLIAQMAFGPGNERPPYPTRKQMQAMPRTPPRVLVQQFREAGWLPLIQTLGGLTDTELR